MEIIALNFCQKLPDLRHRARGSARPEFTLVTPYPNACNPLTIRQVRMDEPAGLFRLTFAAAAASARRMRCDESQRCVRGDVPLLIQQFDSRSTNLITGCNSTRFDSDHAAHVEFVVTPAAGQDNERTGFDVNESSQGRISPPW